MAVIQSRFAQIHTRKKTEKITTDEMSKKLEKQIALVTGRYNREKAVAVAKIEILGEFTFEEKNLIIEINDHVMSADGINAQWGGPGEAVEYVEASVGIFKKCKSFFSTDNQKPAT